MGRVESTEGNVFPQVLGKGQVAPHGPCLATPEQNKACDSEQNIFRQVTSDVPSFRETQDEEGPDNFNKKVVPVSFLVSDPGWGSCQDVSSDNVLTSVGLNPLI